MSGRRSDALGGYTVSLFARHLLLSLTHMRRVAREMVDAGAGWGAFAAIAGFSGLILAAEMLVRGVITPTAEWAIPDNWSVFSQSFFWALNVALAFSVTLALAVVCWATCLLFRLEVSLRQSAVGVVAGLLPMFAISLALVVLAFVLSLVLEANTRLRALEVVENALMLALVAYGVVAYAAVTGIGLMQAIAIQLVGVAIACLLLLAALLIGGLSLDAGLAWIVQLVLG